MNDVLSSIDPTREYTLKEIANANLIPGIQGYSGVYGLVTIKKPDPTNKTKYTHILRPETTKRGIKAVHQGKSWNKISGKIMVHGRELLKFLNMNGLV